MNDPSDKNSTAETSAETSAEGTAQGRPLTPESFNRFLLYLYISGIALLGAAWSLGGLDFTKPVLVAFLVVLLNVYWTKSLVKSILFAGKPKGLFTFFYFFKFGLTALVLILTIGYIKMDPLGILLGLSSLMLATLLFAVDWTWFRG